MMDRDVAERYVQPAGKKNAGSETLKIAAWWD